MKLLFIYYLTLITSIAYADSVEQCDLLEKEVSKLSDDERRQVWPDFENYEAVKKICRQHYTTKKLISEQQRLAYKSLGIMIIRMQKWNGRHDHLYARIPKECRENECAHLTEEEKNFVKIERVIMEVSQPLNNLLYDIDKTYDYKGDKDADIPIEIIES